MRGQLRCTLTSFHAKPIHSEFRTVKTEFVQLELFGNHYLNKSVSENVITSYIVKQMMGTPAINA